MPPPLCPPPQPLTLIVLFFRNQNLEMFIFFLQTRFNLPVSIEIIMQRVDKCWGFHDFLTKTMKFNIYIFGLRKL